MIKYSVIKAYVILINEHQHQDCKIKSNKIVEIVKLEVVAGYWGIRA